MCTISRIFISTVFLFSFSYANAVSYFGGIGADYMDPRIERNNLGSSSFSTASEVSYQYYGTLGIHIDRKKKHSLRLTYTERHLELEAPSNRTFSELKLDFDSFNIMYNYSGQSFDMYLDYLQDKPLVFDNQTLMTTFNPTAVKSTFIGAGLRFKAYSDKPHNLFSYNRYRTHQDDKGSKTSYSKGFRLVIDVAYYYQIGSDTHIGSKVDYSSKIKSGIKIEKGGTFNYGAKINFITERYEWSNDSYSVLDFGGGVFLKVNY